MRGGGHGIDLGRAVPTNVVAESRFTGCVAEPLFLDGIYSCYANRTLIPSSGSCWSYSGHPHFGTRYICDALMHASGVFQAVLSSVFPREHCLLCCATPETHVGVVVC